MKKSELLVNMLEGKSPVGIPWFADLSYYYFSLEQKGILPEKYKGEKGYLQFHRDQQAGIYVYCPSPYTIRYRSDVEYSETTRGVDTVSTFKTPIGTIVQVSTYFPQTFASVITKHYVENFNDLLVMRYVFEHAEYDENNNAYSRIRDMWKDAGEAVALPPISVSPFQKLAARWAGVEKTIELMCDYDEDFDEILSAIDASQDPCFEVIARSGARIVEFAENLSSDITGKTLYEKYNSPCYRKNIRTLHEAGKFTAIHIDGYLKGCLPFLEKDGFDIAEAVTPAPIGDVDVEDLRKTAGEQIILWGGIPGALFSGQYTDDFFMDYLQNILRTFREDGKFVLGVADQVPPDCKEGRIAMVGEYLRTFNKEQYHIDLE